MRARVLCAAALSLAACASDEAFVVVTVTAPPAVHDVAALTVTLGNAGTTRMDTLALDGRALPATFSISAPGRTGELAIAIDASDAGNVIVGRGTATTTVGGGSAAVALVPTDFVVNTDLAGDQFTSNDFEASGFQLAALPDGTWTAAFRDECQGDECTIYARRFAADGAALQSAVAVGTNAFPLSTKPSFGTATPALAASAMTTLAVWDFADVTGDASGVACRALDPTGAASPAQLPVATESADVVSIAALDTGNFVASWTSSEGIQGIHAIVIQPDCTPVGVVRQVSAESVTSFIHRGAVASSGDRALFTWVADGNLHARMMSSDGVLLGADAVLVDKTALDEIAHARIAPVAGGYLVALRWTDLATTTAPGRIEVIKLDAMGQRVGDPIVITDRSGSDLDNSESFGFASRGDRAMVVWHTCSPNGDDSQCGVFGRVLRDTGEPLDVELGLATTTAGDQTRPSVAGLPDGFVALWTDASQRPPDTAGQSVRARIIYP